MFSHSRTAFCGFKMLASIQLWLVTWRRDVGATVGAGYFFEKNFPNPKRTCTVLMPGFGVVNPALEMCM
jgi:hypothetical protein